ncbi:hypothetical protein [Microbacterium proteolyticum]|uniref:hypothetical protein n=1 Tax=Microbacterium proteolyticum TaxID=1572644 RepID=UPI001FAD1AED|nr:hypothetical protein [Microbacterium proteolyticum]MCI9858212.1 hypothetical protein [Microbacterium proteolyticum]
MQHPYAHHVIHQPVWATPLATVVLWTAVIALAAAGAVMIITHGDAGVFLLVAALIVAAPAAASSRYRSYH